MPTIAIDEQEALSDLRNAHCNANFANLMKSYNNLPLKKMMSFKQNSTAKDAELKPLLTSEQYASYEQKKSEMEATIKQKLKEKHAASSQPAS
jgi:LAS superfamily LD-carboxypeptidase LdcB